MNMKEYMKKVGVTKAKYVEQWIERDLIPGIIRGESLSDTVFPDSARRPYCEGSLKPELSADKIRAHIVKACIQRRHITKDTCYASQGEFDGQLQMRWDNGQSLALIPEEDVFRKLTAAELAEEQTMQEVQGFEMKME